MEIEVFYKIIKSKCKCYLTEFANFEPQVVTRADYHQNICPDKSHYSYTIILHYNLNETHSVYLDFSYDPFVEKYYGCGCSIEKEGNYIDIMEYLKYRKLRNWDNLLGFSNQNTLQPHLDIYLKELNEVLKIEEVQKLLYTDYWIDIPIDMWPYK